MMIEMTPKNSFFMQISEKLIANNASRQLPFKIMMKRWDFDMSLDMVTDRFVLSIFLTLTGEEHIPGLD